MFYWYGNPNIFSVYLLLILEFLRNQSFKDSKNYKLPNSRIKVCLIFKHKYVTLRRQAEIS
jgi:hypothetical protein